MGFLSTDPHPVLILLTHTHTHSFTYNFYPFHPVWMRYRLTHTLWLHSSLGASLSSLFHPFEHTSYWHMEKCLNFMFNHQTERSLSLALNPILYHCHCYYKANSPFIPTHTQSFPFHPWHLDWKYSKSSSNFPQSLHFKILLSRFLNRPVLVSPASQTGSLVSVLIIRHCDTHLLLSIKPIRPIVLLH